MFSSCSQLIRAHSQLIQAERLHYSHLIRVEKVRCSQAQAPMFSSRYTYTSMV